jgi:hypothetical protein
MTTGFPRSESAFSCPCRAPAISSTQGRPGAGERALPERRREGRAELRAHAHEERVGLVVGPPALEGLARPPVPGAEAELLDPLAARRHERGVGHDEANPAARGVIDDEALATEAAQHLVARGEATGVRHQRPAVGAGEADQVARGHDEKNIRAKPWW